MDLPHGYRAFGLNILSAFEIPFWLPGGPPWDVRIERGDVPRELAESEMLWDGVFHGRRGICILDFDRIGIGRMFVEAGERVSIAPAANADPHFLAHIIASNVLSAVLYQRGALCLHASAVGWRGRAYLVMGPSGAGKSTTASALLARGGEFISDDITVVTARPGGDFVATCSFPAVRLRVDSHREIGARLAGREQFVPAENKIRVHHGGAIATEVPIARICFIEKDAAISVPKMVSLTGHERVGALQRSFFRRRMAKILTDPVRLAATSIALAQGVDVARLTRPESGFALDALCDLVVS